MNRIGTERRSPVFHGSPGYQEALSHAYDTAESLATARDQILTATPLSKGAIDGQRVHMNGPFGLKR